jgi:hypothetical protein
MNDALVIAEFYGTKMKRTRRGVDAPAGPNANASVKGDAHG